MSIIVFLQKLFAGVFGLVGDVRNPAFKGTQQVVVKAGLTEFTVVDVYFASDSAGNPAVIVEVQ